jgi:hypothetical protein
MKKLACLVIALLLAVSGASLAADAPKKNTPRKMVAGKAGEAGEKKAASPCVKKDTGKEEKEPAPKP